MLHSNKQVESASSDDELALSGLLTKNKHRGNVQIRQELGREEERLHAETYFEMSPFSQDFRKSDI